MATVYELHTGTLDAILAGIAAGGTLLLAAGTAILAWKTKDLAAKTKEVAAETRELARATREDVESQYRPLLIVDKVTGGTPVVLERGNLTIQVRNVGNGPALNVQATIFPEGAGPWNWDQGAIAQDATASVLFVGAKQETDRTITVELAYQDLNRRNHYTGIILDFEAKDPETFETQGIVRNVVFYSDSRDNKPVGAPAGDIATVARRD